MKFIYIVCRNEFSEFFFTEFNQYKIVKRFNFKTIFYNFPFSRIKFSPRNKDANVRIDY